MSDKDRIEKLKMALKAILHHVEDSGADRIMNQCTLCRTFRKIGWDALAEVEN